jgi:hypothetical protein
MTDLDANRILAQVLARIDIYVGAVRASQLRPLCLVQQFFVRSVAPVLRNPCPPNRVGR